MNKKLIISYFVLFFSVITYSQQILIEYQKKNDYHPGKAHPLVFKITNNTSKTLHLNQSVILPKFWKQTTKLNPLILLPNTTKVEIVTVFIPYEATEQSYMIEYSVVDAVNYINVKKYITIDVKGVSEIILKPYQAPDFVTAGNTIKASFIIQNNGNRKEKVTLHSITAAIQDSSILSLMPNTYKIVNVTQNTSANLESINYNLIKLDAHLANNPLYQKSAYANIKVIPIIETKKDAYLRFPIAISATYIGRKNGGEFNDGFQGEFFGKGGLNKSETKFLELKAVTPDSYNLSVFGKYEEYYAKYTSNHLNIHAGDKTYSASFLTELARYGRGIDISATFNKFIFGGFYNRPRFFNGIKDETHAFMQFNFNRNNYIKYGFLNKKTQRNETVNLHSISSQVMVFKNTTLQSEYALSNSDKGLDYGYYLQAQGYYKNVNFNAIYLKAHPNFFGYYNNTNFISTNVRYNIFPKVTINANYYKDAQNFERDTLYGAAPYSNRHAYGISYNYTKNVTILLNNGYRERKDLMQPKKFHYKERYYSLNVFQKIGLFNINADAQFAETYNFLTNLQAKSTIVGSNISFNKLLTDFNIYGSYLKTNRYDRVTTDQFVYNIQTNTQLSPNTQIQFFYQNTYTLEDYYRDRNLFELQLSQYISLHHKIDLIGRYALTQQQVNHRDLAFLLKYTLYINTPIKKIADYSTLTGRIDNQGVSSVEGIKLSLNSHMAITDKNGYFKFTNVVPNTSYLLAIDQSTIDLHDISNIVLPKEIEIKQKEHHIDFALTKAGNISGKINLKETKKAENIAIIVEIVKASETYRKICTANSSFLFSNLRPGTWQVNIYRNGLNKLYQIQNTVFSVDVTSNVTKEIAIDITQQERHIKFLQNSIKVTN